MLGLNYTVGGNIDTGVHVPGLVEFTNLTQYYYEPGQSESTSADQFTAHIVSHGYMRFLMKVPYLPVTSMATFLLTFTLKVSMTRLIIACLSHHSPRQQLASPSRHLAIRNTSSPTCPIILEMTIPSLATAQSLPPVNVPHMISSRGETAAAVLSRTLAMEKSKSQISPCFPPSQPHIPPLVT